MDELLCQSLLLFRQYRFYDAPECGEKAFRILEEAHVWMGRTQECVDMAKWGCVIECLAQKYYIEDDTDAILEESMQKSPPFIYGWGTISCYVSETGNPVPIPVVNR